MLARCRLAVPVILRAFWLGVALLMLASGASAIGPFPSVLNPRTYRSPSGEYELLVNPTKRYGEGPAWYRLRKKGHEIWGGKRPFTLSEAEVADDGTVGGYAYLGGEDSDDHPFAVVVIAPNGRTVTDHRTARSSSRFLHTFPNPRAQGMFLDLATRELVVRVADEDVNAAVEWWWRYPLTESRTEGGPTVILHEGKPSRQAKGRNSGETSRPSPKAERKAGPTIPRRSLVLQGAVHLQPRGGMDFPEDASAEIAQCALGAGRVVYLLESPSGRIHTFDVAGRPLRVLQPGGPPPTSRMSTSFAISPRGEVQLIGTDGGLQWQRVARFGPAGSFLGWQPVEGDSFLRWHYHSPTGRRWEIDSERIVLRSFRGQKLWETERFPDQTWLDWPDDTAVAPGGALVGLWGVLGSEPALLCVFGADGRSGAMFRLPEKGDAEHGMFLASDGRRIFVVDRISVLALDLSGKPLWRARIPEKLVLQKSVLLPMVDPHRNELLLYNRKRTLYRFAL